MAKQQKRATNALNENAKEISQVAKNQSAKSKMTAKNQRSRNKNMEN